MCYTRVIRLSETTFRTKHICGTSKSKFYLATDKELIRVKPDQNEEKRIMGNLWNAPTDVVLDEASDRLYTCLSDMLKGSIFVTTLDGSLISKIGFELLKWPTGICLFENYICVCEIGRISVWNRFTGEFVKYIIVRDPPAPSFGDYRMRRIISVGDQLLLSYSTSSRIYVYDFCDGTLRYYFDIPSGKVNGMTLLDENVFIASNETCIYRYR